MLFIESFVRYGTAVTALLGAILFITDAHQQATARWIALFLISLAFGAIIHTAEGIAPPVSVRAVLLPISSSFIVFLWIAAQAYYDDEFKVGAFEQITVGVWLLLLAFDYFSLVTNTSTSGSLAATIRQGLSYLLVGHIVYVVVHGKLPDLVETRRRMRTGFVVSVLSLYLLNRGGEIFFGYSALPIWFTTLLYGLILLLLAYALLALIKLDQNFLAPQPKQTDTNLEAASIPIQQQHLMDKLNHIMTAEQAFLEPNLSIQKLAQRMGIAEYQLRALINQVLGFRNFRSFLNGYRVEHANLMLSSTKHSDLSVLNIAMSSGFGSLASFNRTFKTMTGQTPKEARSIKKSNNITS